MLRIDDTQQGQVLSAYVTDALGTPMQLVTPNGDTRWQAQPDDWAAVKHQRGNTTQSIRFQGQWHDEESGLYYNRHRYYDPQQGRYISQDPIGLKGSMNLYGYVTNPTGMVDPLGLEGEHIFWRAIKDVPRMFGQYISDRRTASSQSMCSVLGNLEDNEAMLSVAGGKGLAAELGLKASSSGISTIAGIGAGGGAALVASVGQSINYGAISEHSETAWRGFTSISAGTGVVGGDASLSTGTDGITGSMRGGYGFGAAIVSGAQVETYILDCHK
jgi:RHS repeat-associated protein